MGSASSPNSMFPNVIPLSMLLLEKIFSSASTQEATTVSIDDDDNDGIGCCVALVDVIVEPSRRIVNIEKPDNV